MTWKKRTFISHGVTDEGNPPFAQKGEGDGQFYLPSECPKNQDSVICTTFESHLLHDG